MFDATQAAGTTIADMRAMHAAMRARFDLSDVPSIHARRASLDRLTAGIRAHRQDIRDALSSDFGHRAEMEALTADIGATLDFIAHARRRLPRWAAPKRRLVMRPLPGWATRLREPKGLVGILSPWNYPIYLCLVPLATAVATGNRAILKPSERAPASAAIIARIVTDALPGDAYAVVTGDVDLAQAMAVLPWEHLFYTGSEAIGRRIAAQAATTMTPLTLELGGKSPAIAMPDARPDDHAPMVAWGKFYAAGQTCVAPDYLLVPKGRAAEWADAILDTARAFVAGEGAPDYTGLIDGRHRERIAGLVRDAAARGATVRALDPIDGRDDAHPPAVVLCPPPDAEIMTQEVFGPVLSILEYDDLDHARRIVAANPNPLAAYAFGADAGRARRFVTSIRSGNAAVNVPMVHVTLHDVPFGGIGSSGMGAYHGERGFVEFSHERSLFQPLHRSVLSFLPPPYDDRARAMVRWLSR
ncbi:aldehyde dehydrogenase family protein [Jannaschia sp. LMIT008]|uniref:aldehyde dehydrogenase family protein n=1 Tax=Jannaschia maritima TaxID=3032585 RepID=UPI002810A495|nr:aldehyde dehydrogenase family protein [Jannaschia sp. LMIT008]